MVRAVRVDAQGSHDLVFSRHHLRNPSNVTQKPESRSAVAEIVRTVLGIVSALDRYQILHSNLVKQIGLDRRTHYVENKRCGNQIADFDV